MIPISAILPVRNAAKWLPTTFPSVLANLESTDELIVIDDGSTDSSLSILKKLSKDKELRILNGKGKGLVHALNLGLEFASHEWIARFDADDVYPTQRLNLQRVQFSPNLGVIFSDYEFFLNGRKSLGIIPSPVFDFPTRLSLLRSQRTAHPSAILNKSMACTVGGYQESDFPAEDLSLWLRISKVGKLESIPHIGLKYNLNTKSISSTRYLQAKEKTIELVKTALDSDFLNEFIPSEIESVLNDYDSLTLSRERRALYVYDLVNREFFNRRTSQEQNSILHAAIREVSRPKSVVAASGLLFESIRRRLARIS